MLFDRVPNLVRLDFSAPVLPVDALVDAFLLVNVVTALDPELETQSFQESAHVVEGSIRIRPAAQDALHKRIIFSHDGCLRLYLWRSIMNIMNTQVPLEGLDDADRFAGLKPSVLNDSEKESVIELATRVLAVTHRPGRVLCGPKETQ